ncbi:hypothetical protein ASE21_03050 [Flavobacterium sp. Root901]|nr:hypothetical protein ASE21_03050 [Flavobacterium sp. Root901]
MRSLIQLSISSFYSKNLFFNALTGASFGRSVTAKKYSFFRKRLFIAIWASPVDINKKSYPDKDSFFWQNILGFL